MAAPGKKTKYSKLDPVHINIGLQVLYPNPDETSSSKSTTKLGLDIVAIPGLGANPEWTWVREKVHWLRDSNMLARRIPNARISVFQYQSQWFGKGSVDQRLENVANQLLYALDRSRGNENKTPIIFVCHCLGGIILEKALLTARLRQNDFPSIFPYVAGCIFLGTPFHGTKSQNKAKVLAEMAETIGMGVSSSLLNLLKDDSEVLIQLLDDFYKLSQDAQIRLFCFFESQKSDLAALFIKGLPFKSQELIVDEASATFPGVEKLQLASDHFSLNKYNGPKDGNYISVSNEIKTTAAKAAGIIKSRQNALRQALVNDRTYHALIDALGKGFSDIEQAVKGTYKGPKGNKTSWVEEVDKFKSWKDEQLSQLLWVHGKAGTGQGSIASSVIESLNKTRDQASIVASFFCDQGDEHRRSVRDLLKLLIRQVIDLNQDLAVHLLTDSKKNKTAGKQDFDADSLSKTSVLWEALQAMAKDLPSGCIYIVLYGLEQLSKDSLSEFLQLVQDLPGPTSNADDDSDDVPIKWLLLSRSGRPDIEKVLKTKALEINIDDSENSAHVSDALRADISDRVNDLELSAPLAYFVKRHIHSRAEDNYIYVSLVIQELKNAQMSGKSQHAQIRALLESFPYGLTDMFEYIRKRVLDPNTESIEYTKEILRCLILAQRAPTMRELAIMADLPTEDREDLEKLKTYIIRCGAFLTLNGSEWDEDSMTVEWIDVSAQEHLEKYAKDDLALDLNDMQHGIIALRCLEYIYRVTDQYEAAEAAKRAIEDTGHDNEEDNGEDQDEDQQDTSQVENEEQQDDELQSQHPADDNEHNVLDDAVDNDEVDATSEAPPQTDGNYDQDGDEFDDDDALQYPVQYWIEHAKLAPVDVIQEFRTGHAFWKDDSRAREDWWKVNDAIHPFDGQANVTPLHVAVITGFSAFVDHLLTYGWMEDINKEDSVGFQPLYYACMRGEYEIVETLLGVEANIDFVSDEGKVTALHGACAYGHMDIVECLVDRAADINTTSEEYGSPLYAATDNNHLDIMQLLIDRGANVNLIGGAGRRPLNIASFNGNFAAVQKLIEHGADVDPDEEYWYGSAVGSAARRGHADVVKLLLSKGWSPSKTMKTYGSFLTAAATYGHQNVVDILVEKEARITVLEQALAAASQNGKATVVKAILEKTPTLRHQKAFMLAAFYGRNDVLELLFPRGMPKDKLNEALYNAADQEREETVKLLLEFGADPNAEGPTYGCALTASAYDGTEGILQALLEKGADVNKRGGDYGTALQAAALYGESENVKMLLEHGALVNTEPIGMYGHPLQAAAYTGDADTIRVLLKHGADINARGGKFNYAIIAAVDNGDSEVLKILLEHNADVNVRGGEDNWPVISLAGITLPKEDLEEILNHGADVNATCDHHTTALINCAESCDTEGLEFLIAHGADVHAVSDNFGTALHACAVEGDEDCCEVLLKAGADVNSVGGPYGTPLQCAAYAADIDSVRVLLNAGADATGIDCVAGEFGTPLQAACSVGDIEIVRELIEHGAVIDLEPANGKFGYALSAAAASGHMDIVELLLEHDANVSVEGGLHGFPLLAAAQAGDEEIVQLLLDHGASASVEGGLLGSAIQAAAIGNNLQVLELLIDRGANVHAKGGKFGHALTAAVIKADDELIDVLLAHGVDVNYHGGKYYTSLIAATYFDKLDLVTKLLDHGADFRYRGGNYGSAISAASIRGNKTVLEKFLKMGPPDELLDEALVQACAHRQTACVEALLKSGANVYARHPTLGYPVDTLKADQADGYNSDDEPDEPQEDETDEDEDDSTEDDDEWEGDDGSVAGQTDEGSVTDLELEDQLSEETKIQKLLDEAMARVKRNPSVQRFRTVKRRGLPPSLSVGGPPPPMPHGTSHQQFNPPMGGNAYGQPYSQQQRHDPSRQALQPYLSPGQQVNHGQQGYPPPNNSGYAPYRGSVSNAPQLPQQSYQSPSTSPPRQQQQQQQQQRQGYLPPQPQRQYSNGPPSYGSQGTIDNAPPLPPRVGSQEHMSQRYSAQSPGNRPQLNPGSSGRYQQQQQRQPSYQEQQPGYRKPVPQQAGGTPPAQNPYASPPQSSYGSPTPPHQYSQHTLPYGQPPPQHQQYQSPPPSQYQPYSSPPGQETGYIPYGQPSQSSSQTSFQSSQYANSTSYGGSQGYVPYGTPNSSQMSGFSGSNGQGQTQGHGRRWNTGGYDGEGYG